VSAQARDTFTQSPASSTIDARPTAIRPNPQGIPGELKTQRRWVVWRYAWRKGKWTKVPYTPGGAYGARSNDPQTWRSWDNAWTAYQDGEYDGIGFMLGNGYVGVDFDACLNPETRGGAAWAQPSLDALLNQAAYVEASPSVTGFKAIVRGEWHEDWNSRDLPHAPLGGKDTAKLEIFAQKRFFTLTGSVLGPDMPQIVEAQDILDKLARDFAPPSREKNAAAAPLPDMGATPNDDLVIIERARTATNGDKFLRLWNGDMSDYSNDQSRAELALCSLLAFWTGPDAARVDRLIRRSGLGRDKWDSPRGDTTYGTLTIALALSDRTEYYDWARPTRDAEDASGNQDTSPVVPLAELIDIASPVMSESDSPQMVLVDTRLLGFLLRETAAASTLRGKYHYLHQCTFDKRLTTGQSLDVAALADICGVPSTSTPITEPVRVCREKIQDRTGQSLSTISVNVPDLADMGIINLDRRQVQRTRTIPCTRALPNGTVVHDVKEIVRDEEEWWISVGRLPDPAITKEELQGRATRKAQEASRKRCPSCGSHKLEAALLRCTACEQTCTNDEAAAAGERIIERDDGSLIDTGTGEKKTPGRPTNPFTPASADAVSDISDSDMSTLAPDISESDISDSDMSGGTVGGAEPHASTEPHMPPYSPTYRNPEPLSNTSNGDRFSTTASSPLVTGELPTVDAGGDDLRPCPGGCDTPQPHGWMCLPCRLRPIEPLNIVRDYAPPQGVSHGL